MVKMKPASIRYSLIAFMLSVIAMPAYAQQTDWIDGNRLVLQTLDKVTARIQTVDAVIGEPVRFGTLEITPHYCAFRPPELPPDHSAFLEIKGIALNAGRSESQKDTSQNSIKDIASDSLNPAQTVFSGWMFASSPALSGLEHAVYDVTLLNCSK
jgi:hypothetical protein